jgi:hypothetical protein
MSAARVVKVTLGLGAAILIAVCAYALTRSPPRVIRAGPKATGYLGGSDGDAAACQTGEALPAGVSAIRLSIGAYVGARIQVSVFSGSKAITQGSRSPNWTGTSVTVPVVPLRDGASNVTVCFNIAPNNEAVFLLGREVPASEALVLSTGARLAGRLDIEYLGAGQGSWWSRVLSVARHMGLGRAFSGTWIALLIAAMVAAIGVLAGGLALRELS